MAERGSQATFGMLLGGFEVALARFLSASSQQDVEGAYYGLYETLNWTVTIDDAIAEWWRPRGERLGYAWRDTQPDGELFRGLRFARNRVHHQWADALLVEGSGLRFPMTFPLRFTRFEWRPAAELPPEPENREDPKGRAAYGQYLEGEPADDTLRSAGRVFDRLWQMLSLPDELRLHASRRARGEGRTPSYAPVGRE